MVFPAAIVLISSISSYKYRMKRLNCCSIITDINATDRWIIR